MKENERHASDWRKIKFRGMDAIVSEGRWEPKELPEEYMYFCIRHSDNDWDDPITIEHFVLVNYWGMIGIGIQDFHLKLTHGERDLIRGRP